MKVFGRTLTLVVLISLAVGMGSAVVLSNYGVISGTANVEGPTFYAGPNENLLINEKPELEETPQTYVADFNGDEAVIRLEFDSKELDPSNWYEMAVETYAKVEMVKGEKDASDGIEVEVRADTTEGVEVLCTKQYRDLELEEEEDIYGECTDIDLESKIKGFEYRFESLNDESTENAKFNVYINTRGDTRFEVNAQ